MAPSVGPVSSRRSSGEVFDPTAYAARRKEKLQAAAVLREQRKREQEKRESDRGAATPILVRGPAVDYTFAPLTPRQSASPPQAPSPAKSGDGEEAAGSPGPHYLTPLRRSLTGGSPPAKEAPTEPPKPPEAKPSPKSSSFAQALPPFRSPSLASKKGPKKRAAGQSSPGGEADGEEPPSGSPPPPVSEGAVADSPGDDTENQAPPALHVAPPEKKVSPAKGALALLKSKLRLTRTKPTPPSPPQGSDTSSRSAEAPPAPQREALSPTLGRQGHNVGLAGEDTRSQEGRRLSNGGQGQEAVQKEAEAGRGGLGRQLARVLSSRRKKEAKDSPAQDGAPLRSTKTGVPGPPTPQWQAPENELPAGGPVRMQACPDCGRSFSEEALSKHAKVCRKVFGQKRKTFNVAAHRLEGTEAAKFVQPPSGGRGAKGGAGTRVKSSEATPLKKVPAWKQQSAQLQAAIQASRKFAAAKAKGVDLASLPPPPPSENLDYVPCPHCSRRFAPQTAERHIPKCKDTVHRPKPVVKRSMQGAGQKKKGKG